jgi:hypothetical protein
MAGPAGVSADNPALAAAKPKQPWINRAALVAALRRQFVVLRVAAPVALVLFGISWWIAGPSSFEWKPIGARGELTLVPVNGRVTHNGQGVAAARVVFLPHGQSFRSAEAVTDSDGRFELQFADGHAGTPPGKYRVQIQKMAENGRDMIPSAYGGLTRQTYEVMPGGSTIDVDIKTAEPK